MRACARSGQKIRYFSDRRFRRRLLPPPAKPAAVWESGPGSPGEPVAAIAQSSAAPSGPEVSGAAPIRTREATVEDIERIERLTLEEFGTEFSEVKHPHTE